VRVLSQRALRQDLPAWLPVLLPEQFHLQAAA
jgi:hypothetical protein